MSAPDSSEPDGTALRARIDALASTWAVPGGVVVVTDAHGDLFTHSFGYADVDRGIRAEPHHLFEIGSISKLFTAAAVLHLVHEGRLRLDQPIGDILPWVPSAMAGARIDHLLQHTAGLVSGIDAVPDQLAQVAGFTGRLSEAEPGSWHHYSNLGFILAGLAVQQLTGRPLAQVQQELIFDPLGMRRSTATVTNADYDRVARGYRAVHDDRPWLPGDAQRVADWLEVDGADGSIAQTAGDLAIFARVLLARGAGLPEPSVVERMMSTLAPTGESTVALARLEPVTRSRYGLGVNVETVGGRTVLSHGGGMVGYASFLLADLDAGIGVVVLTNANGTSPIAEVIARTAASMVISGAVVPELAPERWAVGGTSADVEVRPRPLLATMLGRFVAQSPEGGEHELLVVAGPSEGGSCELMIEAEGAQAALLWSWSEAVGTRHPRLAGFPLHVDGEGWTWRDRVYRRTARPTVAPTGPWSGHYRSYSPWYPNFRVLEREGVLLAVSAPAVESPGDEVELVELEPAVFRIGADPRNPERLTFGPVIDGAAAWVDRDGCRYSRSFLD